MKFKKSLAMLLASAMVVTGITVPTTAYAAETEDGIAAHDESVDENLVLNKTAKLEEDGTYTIQLEAYAKGEVVTTVEKETIPLDIVLVVDQSGSMSDTSNQVTGIPVDGYVLAENVTNKEVAEGKYYYHSNGRYYKVYAEMKTHSAEERWTDGTNYYDESQVVQYQNGDNYLQGSLNTYRRTSNKQLVGTTYAYVDKNDNAVVSSWSWNSSTSGVKDDMVEYLKKNNLTYEFSSDDATVVAYKKLTKQSVGTVQYKFYYLDANGQKQAVSTTETGDASVIGAARFDGQVYSYKGTTMTGTRLDSLKYSARHFLNDIYTNAVESGADHRVAIVGFGSDTYSVNHSNYNNYYYANSELFIGSTQYNYKVNGKHSTYNKNGNLASDHYEDAFQYVNTDEGYTNIDASIGAFEGYGGTHPSLGFDMANGIFAANDTQYTRADGTIGTRERVVIFITDGEPGENGYDSDEASDTLKYVEKTKNTYGATVYTVAGIEKVTSGSNIDKFLKNTSSDGTYILANKAAELEDFFSEVTQTITSNETTITLTEDAELRDYLSDDFELPVDFTVENNVTVQIAPHTGNETFGNPANLQLEVGKRDGYVYVTGYDYVSDTNLVTTNQNGTGSGNKLIVTIKGVLAKDSAIKSGPVETNKTDSAIWDYYDDDETHSEYGIIKQFNMPTTQFADKVFVLDYAKLAVLDAFDAYDMEAEKVDSAADALMSKVSVTSKNLAGTYGSVELTDELRYTPTTMKWDGYDTFYTLGHGANATVSQNYMWSRVTVMPANNVYYEDTFVTDNSTGRVGIEYGGTWETVTSGTPGTNVEHPEDAENDVLGGVHGWEDDLADDAQYSDGTAHVANKGATATFEFTGTAVDVYSRTNFETGSIFAALYENDNKVAVRSYSIDHYAQSGDYYQIPTLSFTTKMVREKDAEGNMVTKEVPLPHGTYTVKIAVTSTSDKVVGGARDLYYLDGIRVYNPLQNIEDTNDVVQDAYGDEWGASFTEVRDILIDAATFADEGYKGDEVVSGTVFIDLVTKVTEAPTDGPVEFEKAVETAELGTYVEYGPKNEVYLAKDQAIVFAVADVGDASSKITIGLKGPKGTATARVTNGENVSDIKINAASDLYYEITPSNAGMIMIINKSDSLLSITKLKTSQDPVVATASMMSLMNYANTFSMRSVVSYAGVPEEMPESPLPEDSNDGNAEDEVVKDETIDFETEETPKVEIENQDSDQDFVQEIVTEIKKILNQIFENIYKWF